MTLPLPQLKIDSPCPVAWDTMRGDHASRFCDQCRLHVHNVSAMTRPEVRRLMVASRGRVCLNGFVRPDGELVTLEALADLLEQHGASPERVAVIRAAVTAGLAAVAVSLAACSIEPNRHGGDTRPVAAPADSNSAPRTGGIVAPTPAAELKPPPSHAGGISWEEALWLSHLGETDPH